MSGGKDPGEALLTAVNELCAELGRGEATYETHGVDLERSAVHPDLIWGTLSAEDESLVLKMRARLAGLAAVIGTWPAEGVTRQAILVALDSTELVMRGELLRGNAGQLPGLVPSFVYLVAAPLAGQDEALSLSRRTSELIRRARSG